jgi:2'-5' RNA ligase
MAATEALRTTAPEIGWVTEPRLHFTLKFFGEVDPARLDELSTMAATVAERHREFAMTFGGVGAFPNFRRARVVWLGVEQEARLELLHHDIEVACEALGFEIEARAFRPHLTLGRVKHGLPEDRLRTLARAAKCIDFRADFDVRTIDMMASELAPTGSTYRTLLSAALRSH